MAKHPVPKKKVCKSRKKRRYSGYQKRALKNLTDKTHLVPCTSCGEMKLNHHVCKACGQYNGKTVIDMGKKIDKVTKIKA